MDSTQRAAPFLKWAGGKRQLLPALLARMPESVTGRYFEPFVGGGALFFELAAQGRIGRARLSDGNAELVLAYQYVRDHVEDVIAALDLHVGGNREDYFYAVRDLDPAKMGKAEQVARLIYLNRVAFNGLYRVNASGKFNVPFGRYDNPTICDAPLLRAASKALRGVEVEVADFEQATAGAAYGDVVYFDPPYVPLSASSNFASYTREKFGLAEHTRLRDVARRLKQNGAYVIVSNSSAPLVRELYAEGFVVEEVKAARSINSKASKRGTVAELLIR